MMVLESIDAAPKHGDRGAPTEVPVLDRPRGLTIAIGRQAGARGRSIAVRVAELLGWQVFDQEMLSLLVQNAAARDELLSEIPPGAFAWANREVEKLSGSQRTAGGESLAELIRFVFVLAARGEAIIVGRGAGLLLPVETTLNVRIEAPRSERIAYFAQWLRLTEADAAKEVDDRDRQRRSLHESLIGQRSDDSVRYDLALNSSRLGEAACAELIVHALRFKQLGEGSSAELEPIG